MNPFAQFIARIQTIALIDQPEPEQKIEVERVLRYFVWMCREAHSGEPHAAERIQADVQHLRDQLFSEANRRYANRLGVLMGYARALVVEQARKHDGFLPGTKSSARYDRSLCNLEDDHGPNNRQHRTAHCL